MDNIEVRNAGDTVVHQIMFAPAGQSGWHSHPGPAVALIKSGELTLYDGDDETCTGRTFSAGQAFIDAGQGHVHLARNPSDSVNTEVWVTYFDVPIGEGIRIDEAAPGNCPF
jgi:quercetin dioxygenase-like cupin family protein